MGITNKTDGKSADDKMSDKFTQRSKENDSYSEHDPTETVEYQKEQLAGPQLFFLAGAFIIVLTILYVFRTAEMDLNYERELVYKRLAEREEERRFDEERLKSRLGSFRDA